MLIPMSLKLLLKYYKFLYEKCKIHNYQISKILSECLENLWIDAYLSTKQAL